MTKNLVLWGLSFTRLQKYLQWAFKSSFMWIQWKIFEKLVENLRFDLFWPICGVGDTCPHYNFHNIGHNHLIFGIEIDPRERVCQEV